MCHCTSSRSGPSHCHTAKLLIMVTFSLAVTAAALASSTINVYIQGTDAGMREASIDVNSNKLAGDGSFDLIFRAQAGSPLAAAQNPNVS